MVYIHDVYELLEAGEDLTSKNTGVKLAICKVNNGRTVGWDKSDYRVEAVLDEWSKKGLEKLDYVLHSYVEALLSRDVLKQEFSIHNAINEFYDAVGHVQDSGEPEVIAEFIMKEDPTISYLCVVPTELIPRKASTVRIGDTHYF